MRRLDNLTDTEKLQYRSRSERAINGIDILLANPQLVSGKGTITEKYRTIAQYIGLIQDGVSHYNYFIPVNYDIVIMLRFSNHNNENEALYNLHEQKGRPDNRYIIFFQGDGYAILFNGVFCEAQHFVYNYPTYGLDKEEDILAFLTALRELFEKGRTVFRGVREEPRLSNDDITAQWSKTIDKNNGTNESKNMKKNVIKLNEDTLRQIVAECVKKVLNESWSSNVLRQLCREHGNILVNNVPRGVLTSLQQMSDEEITNAYRMAHNGQNANAASIPFEDGFELQLAISNDNVKAQERTLKNWGYGQQQQIQNGNTGYNTHHKRNNPNTPY